jgi:type VI secretion system protein ImpG
VSVTAAKYFAFAPDLPLNTLPIAQRIKGGVRLRLETPEGLDFARTPVDRLTFFVAGPDEVASRIHDLCTTAAIGVLVLPASGASRWHELLPAGSVRPVGFEDDEALLPVTPRSFQGYRLIQEYFSFPQRFRFFELTGLTPAIRRAATSEIEVVILFGRDDGRLEGAVDASNFALNCTPAINLFAKRADRIQVTDAAYEYHVLADRTRPTDYEIYQVTDVLGHGVGSESEQRFLPLYATFAASQEREHHAAFTTRREPRLLSSAQKRHGPRTSYIGTEVFLSLVDSARAPFSRELRQLSVETLCSNRDLPLLMPIGGGTTDLALEIAAPVQSVRVVSGPSRPYAPLADGAVAWRAISHLSLNYFSLANAASEEGAAALRELLALYAPAADTTARRQIDGIRSVTVKPVVRRLPVPGPVAFGRGLEVAITVDDLAFEGASACTLGSVLEQFFARYVSLNSFTETVLRSGSRDEINRWVPRWGARPTL